MSARRTNQPLKDLKMWNDLMIDLETMGTSPTAAVLSIGACFFDTEKCQIGPTFLRTVNLATAVRDGGVIEPATVIWWLGQSQEARDGVRFSGIDIRTALQEFSDYVAENCRTQDVRPWGNSNSFDLTILRGAFERAGMKAPWYWSNERDFRTVRNMYPQIEYNPDDKGSGAHNALADSIFQAKHLFKIKNRNRK